MPDGRVGASLGKLGVSTPEFVVVNQGSVKEDLNTGGTVTFPQPLTPYGSRFTPYPSRLTSSKV